MSLDKQKELIKQLGDLGNSLPGLDKDPIIKNIMDKSEGFKAYNQIVEDEYLDNIDRGMNEADAKKESDAKKEEINAKVKGNLDQSVNEQITIIKQQYKVFKDGLDRIPVDVTAIIANILLPPAIATSGSTPNPVYALNLAKTEKNKLSGLLGMIIIAFTEMLKAATGIYYEIPAFLLELFAQLAKVKTLIDSIPV